jgi:NAD(P)-dependent dehydrogenase (short-subunit alcohol dehydrogenase family)
MSAISPTPHPLQRVQLILQSTSTKPPPHQLNTIPLPNPHPISLTMSSYLISGTSRGIGLALVAELLKDESNFVIATARAPSDSEGLQALSKTYPSTRLHILTLDVESTSSINAAVAEATILLPNGLDNLITNAGVNHQPDTSFEDLDLDLFRSELSFNAVALVELLRAFLPLIRKGTAKKVTIITSQLGSVELGFQLPGLASAYSVGKAALNMTIRKWSPLLKMEGITAFLVHPGWVETDIGDTIKAWMNKYVPQANQITTEESAQGLVKVMEGVKAEDAGNYYNVDGSKFPF